MSFFSYVDFSFFRGVEVGCNMLIVKSHFGD